MSYAQVSAAIRSARKRGLTVEVIALPLDVQHALSMEAAGRMGRLTKIDGIPVVEAQLLTPSTPTPSGLKAVN